MLSKKERSDKEAQFWVLMAQGSTLTAACDAVGVNRRTGQRWRQATGGRIPRAKPKPSGRYLCLEERLRLADLHLAGHGVRAIAREIGRCPSTVSRELHRNEPPAGPRSRGSNQVKYASYQPRNEQSYRAGGQRPVNSMIWNWLIWCRLSCV